LDKGQETNTTTLTDSDPAAVDPGPDARVDPCVLAVSPGAGGLDWAAVKRSHGLTGRECWVKEVERNENVKPTV